MMPGFFLLLTRGSMKRERGHRSKRKGVCHDLWKDRGTSLVCVCLLLASQLVELRERESEQVNERRSFPLQSRVLAIRVVCVTLTLGVSFWLLSGSGVAVDV